LRTCPGLCCGGYFIEIEGTTYLADGLPFDSLDITTATFPLPVYLSWGIVIDNLSCPTERILVCQSVFWFVKLSRNNGLTVLFELLIKESITQDKSQLEL